LIDGDYKIYRSGEEEPFSLFNLKDDPTEQHDLREAMPEKVATLEAYWQRWKSSQEESLKGKDYAR
jgi:arylsulfatase A-like enzyme